MGEGKIEADIPESIPSWIEFQRKIKVDKKIALILMR